MTTSLKCFCDNEVLKNEGLIWPGMADCKASPSSLDRWSYVPAARIDWLVLSKPSPGSLSPSHRSVRPATALSVVRFAGTVIVLTTPDANRTFLSYLGSSWDADFSPDVMTAIRQSRMVAIEGYLWEMQDAASCIRKVRH